MSKFQPSISNVHFENGQVIFTLSGTETYGLDKSFVNAIRRTLLTDIPSVAFRTDENKEKDITINTNTGSLHNELLLQRIGLLPLYINPDNYTKNYLFKLSVKHDTTKPFKFVTAEDFQIYPLLPEVLKKIRNFKESERDDLEKLLTTNVYQNYDYNKPLSDKEKEKIFRPFYFEKNKSKNYCLITELKNTNTDEYVEELDLYGIPSLSTAEENSRHQAVSCATYSYVKDDKLISKLWSDMVKKNDYTKEEEEKEYKKFILENSERYYHRDFNNEPYKYNFHIKSCHYKTEIELFINAINIIIEKLDNLKENFISLLKDKDSNIRVEKKNEILYHLYINNEGHTIGNLLQSHIVRRSIDKDSILSFCGYKKIHPLENIIKLIVSINPEHKIMKDTEQNKYQKTIGFIMDQIDLIKEDFKILKKECEKSF
tara:strand:- start:1675 stop:2961 length:1287 start_codon:yes stop_codon:yes gene_type:complete